jgi:elongation factor P
MKIDGNEIRQGMVISYQNSLWRAVKTMAVKPGKGGAYNQVELKNLFDGRKLNERFRASETVERVTLEQVNCQYLYANGDMLVFMEADTYEQVELPSSFLDPTQLAFLEENMKVQLERHEERYISCRLPDQVTRLITEAEPVVKGQTASSSYKPALLDNGVRIMVPPFIAAGERIIVNTDTVEYVKRAEAA